MATNLDRAMREELVERRRRLEQASAADAGPEIEELLHSVDAALLRIEDGSYGLCAVCHDPIETDRLVANPLETLCLGDLTASQQRALEQDLSMAAQIQRALLPPEDFAGHGWSAFYHYRPAGPVSGDYCDLLESPSGLFFALGDISGKGVAASMLMAHLNAVLRTLVQLDLPIETLVERANRVFCESSLPSHYATLICGMASADGCVTLCNAGHPPPLVVRRGGVECVSATGMPIGLFCGQLFSVRRYELAPGDLLVLYTDGISEATDAAGDEYGRDRLSATAASGWGSEPKGMIASCLEDWTAFRHGASPSDDVTLMTLRRSG
jgi:phosphoserine phosphatase RsbU/P